MTDEDRLSQVKERAIDALNHHNGVYIEKRLYKVLRKEFSDLSRKEFQEVVDSLLEGEYVLEHELIKRLPNKQSKELVKQYATGSMPKKNVSGGLKIPNKRDI
jgi:hypothetical protein